MSSSFLSLALLGLGGCGAALSGDTGAGVTPDLPPCTDCALLDAHNFSYQGWLDVAVEPVQAGADVLVDWSELSVDLLGHAVAPEREVAGARLLAFPELSPAEVADRLVGGTLLQEDLAVAMSCTPAQPACSLSDFSILGSTLDIAEHFVQGSATWLVTLTPVAQPGAASMVFLEPRQDDLRTTVSVGDDSASLTLDVDLLSLQSLVLPVDQRAVSLDWSALSQDGLGQPTDPRRLDRLELARFDLDADRLQDALFDLELLATDWWELPVDGLSSASLDSLPSDFTGLDVDGTWLLALRCSTCDNPMPRFLTVLRARP